VRGNNVKKKKCPFPIKLYYLVQALSVNPQDLTVWDNQEVAWPEFQDPISEKEAGSCFIAAG